MFCEHDLRGGRLPLTAPRQEIGAAIALCDLSESSVEICGGPPVDSSSGLFESLSLWRHFQWMIKDSSLTGGILQAEDDHES